MSGPQYSCPVAGCPGEHVSKYLSCGESPVVEREQPGAHYSAGRRYSHISGAWIFAEDWNDQEECARLKVRLDEARDRLDASETLNTYHVNTETRYAVALQSIANNTCCGQCQEAARVARLALGWHTP